VDTDKLGSMVAQIVLGKPKSESRYVIDEESSRLWDEISREIESLKKQAALEGREISFEIPND